MARAAGPVHDLTAGDGVLKFSFLTRLKKLTCRLLRFQEREEFRLSYVDDDHVFVRNKTRSIAFLLKIGHDEIKRLFPVGVGRVYVVASYDPRNPRKTFKLWENVEERSW